MAEPVAGVERPAPPSAARFVREGGSTRPGVRTACLLLGVGGLAVGLLLLPALPPGIWHDDGVYLLLGRALADGEGLRYAGVPGDPPAPKFPPVYPAVLAALWSLSDNPYGVAQVAALLNVAFVAAVVSLTAAWGVSIGLAVPIAVGTAGLVLFSVELWQTAMVALSEPLFVLVTVLALRLAARVERDGGQRRALGLAGVLILAVHIRTAGAPLIAAAVLGLGRRRRWREAGLVGGASAAALLPWAIWSSRATEQIPAPLRDVLGGYGSWLQGRVLSEPGSYLASLGGGLLESGERFVALLLPGVPPAGLRVLGPLLLLFVAGGLAGLGRRSPTAAIALVLLLVEAWLWPFDASRLLVPVVPLAALSLGCAAAWIAESSPRDRKHTLRVQGTFLAAAAVFAAASALRMARGEVVDRYFARALVLRGAAELIERGTPPDAVVGAPELWAAIPLVTGRRSAPSAPFRPDPSGRTLSGGAPSDQLAVWEAGQLEYLFLEHEGRVNGPALDALERSCPGSVRVVGAAREGPQGAGRRLLVHLGGDPACRAALSAAASTPP